MKPNFEVPYNGDFSVLDLYKKFKGQVSMVYGRAEDEYPSGRNTKKRKAITMDEITQVINTLKDEEIPFNYVLNGNFHGNQEYDSDYRKKFVKFVSELQSRGVEIVTLGNLFLIEAVKQEIPDIDIFASILLEADNLTRIKQLERLGVKYYCPSKTTLKNFNLLEKLGKMDTMVPLLLANDPCLQQCMYTQYHNNALSTFTGEKGAPYQNFSRLHCTQDFASDPRKIISASMIRPEDLSIYQDLGFTHFKLCDRKQTTPWITNMLEAYINESFDGNLSDIMAPWSNIGNKYDKPELVTMGEIESGTIDRSKIRFSPDIDNAALNGYLNYWRNVKKDGCANEDCDPCNYCAKIAKKALRRNESGEEIIVQNIETILTSIRKV